MKTLILALAVALTATPLSDSGTPDAGMSTVGPTDAGGCLDSQRGYLIVKANVLAVDLEPKLGPTSVISVDFAMQNASCVQDAAIVTMVSKSIGTFRLVFVYRNGAWAMFPDTFMVSLP